MVCSHTGIPYNPDIVELLLKQATDVEVLAFFDLPGAPVNFPKLSREFFGKTLPCLSVRGTTYSGHPTRTTLGNTLRSIMYYKFVCLNAGIEPKLIAAGDDVCMWVPKGKLPDLLK